MNTFAKKLRNQSTDAERHLWRYLRGRQILNAKFRRQHSIPPYIVDFACLKNELIIEIDGGQHMERQQQDQDRTRFLETQGFHIIRFWNNEVLNQTEAVLKAIYRELEKHPSPQPCMPFGCSPQRGEGANNNS